MISTNFISHLRINVIRINCTYVTKLQVQIKPQVAPSRSQPEPTKFSLQTQTTMPVHPSYDTEAAQPHLPALAGGIPPAAHPTPCVRLTTLLVCSPSCVFVEPGLYTPPQGWESFVSHSMTHYYTYFLNIFSSTYCVPYFQCEGFV